MDGDQQYITESGIFYGFEYEVHVAQVSNGYRFVKLVFQDVVDTNIDNSKLRSTAFAAVTDGHAFARDFAIDLWMVPALRAHPQLPG